MVYHSPVITATLASFQSEVLESTIPVVVEFWAEWCGPCHALAPLLDDAAHDFENRIKIIKINVDENRELADKYGIHAIPTLLFIKNSQIISRILGVISKQNLNDKISQLIHTNKKQGEHHE